MNQNLEKSNSRKVHYCNNGDGTVTDRNTGLMWTQNDSKSQLKKNLDWYASKEYASNLTTGGYADWRLPSLDELQSIFEKRKSKSELHIDKIFDSTVSELWSCEDDGSNRAQSFAFWCGEVFSHPRFLCLNMGVRAVRRSLL